MHYELVPGGLEQGGVPDGGGWAGQVDRSVAVAASGSNPAEGPLLF